MRNEEVIIISFEDKDSSQDSLLTNMLRAEFKDKVISLRGSGNTFKTYILLALVFIVLPLRTNRAQI